MNKKPDYIGTWLVEGDKEHIARFGGDLNYEFAKLIFGAGFFRFFLTKENLLII